MNNLSKKIFFLILISVSLSYIPPTITGFVYDTNGQPINNVLITSEVDQIYYDKNGAFILLYENKNSTISFERIGYEKKIVQANFFYIENIINLKKQTIDLSEIQISELTGTVKLHNSTKDVHVISSEELHSSDSHFQDIINKIPNLNFSGATSRPRYFQIRGIGERSQYAGEGGPIYYVGTIIDDIDLSGIGMPLFLDDIKQIEVYQGPQSYAYGHNAMAGLIHIKTLDPNDFKKNNSKISIGNGNTINISNYNNFGALLSGKLFINNFFQTFYQDGFIYNSFLDDYTNNKKEYIEKIKILFKPNDLFLSKLTFIISNLNNGYDAWSPNNSVDTTYSNQPGRDSQQLSALSIYNKFNFKKSEIINITNYLDSELEHSYDSDWGNNVFWAQEPYNINSDYFAYEYYQQELRNRTMFSNDFKILNKNITINPNLDFSNTSGFYYKNLTESDDATGWILGGEDIALNSKFKINNYAFYNEIKLNFDRLKIILNARLEQNNLDYQATHFHVSYLYYDYYNPIYDTTYISKEISNNLTGGRAALLYTLNNKNNIYLSLSNGFKAGGINQNPTLTETNQIYEPENNINIDCGWRYTDQQATLNINAFYMYRNNIQLSLSSQLENGNPSSFYFYTANASDGYNYGLNMDLSIVPNENLETYFKFGFLETMINSYQYIIDDVIITNLDREAAHAPSYTYSIGFTKYYRDFYLSGNIDGKDSFYFSDSHNEKSNAYSIANINLGYRINKNTEISIWGKNIFNKAYAIRGFYFALEPVDLDGNGNAWDDEQLYLMYGEPLSFGITFRYNIK